MGVGIGAAALAAGIMATAMTATSVYSAHQQRKAMREQMEAQERANQASMQQQQQALDLQQQGLEAQKAQAEKAFALQENTAKQNEILQNQASAMSVTPPAQTRNAITSDTHYSGVGGVKEDDIFTQVAGLGGDNTLLGGDDNLF